MVERAIENMLTVLVSEQTIQNIILALLTAGGATFIWTVVKSIIAFKNSAEGREDKAVGRLEKFEEDCRTQLAFERKWGSYWSRRAAVLERLLIIHVGQEAVPPPEPEPTKEGL
jgi:hypothetical protein